MTLNLWATPAAERGSLYQPRKRPPHGAANAAPSTSTIRLIRAPLCQQIVMWLTPRVNIRINHIGSRINWLRATDPLIDTLQMFCISRARFQK
jgi:hypothetical protein